MNRTLLLILVLVVSVAGLLALSLQNRPAPATNQPVSIAQTTLSLTTPVASTSGVMTSNILINTQGNKVNGVQVELSYNPQDIGNVDITVGPLIKNPTEFLKKINSDTGRISYALGVGLGEKGVSGSGVVATLFFTKLRTSGMTSITFLPKSVATADEIAQSVLKKTTGITFDLSK